MEAMTDQGLEIIGVVPIRKADADYLHSIWPQLRKEAHNRSREVVALLDLVFIAKRS
jgi:hypothetical protein